MSFVVREIGTEVQFAVRVQPSARRGAVVGLYGDAVKLAIAAPTVDGKANDALLRFLSTLFDVAPARIAIVSGQTSRTKLIRVRGATAASIRQALLPALD